MGSLGNPKTWVPYLNNKDCSQGFCSLYCPQWCYIIYPPPPPPPLAFLRGGPSAGISPLVVAIIGVVASAFLLVGYYAIISKYCGRGAAADERRSSSAAADRRSDYAADDDDEPPLQEPWHAAAAGLDEAAIQAIAAREYRRGDGSVDGTDCSVCLSEFEEGESVRLLPKCGHAFHIQCIDTWLRSHSNCPLCRAGVVVVVVAAAAGLPPEGGASGDESSSAATSEEDSGVPGQSSSRPGDDHEAENNVANNAAATKSSDDPSSARGALGDLEERHAVMIEVRDEIRRSVSMDFSGRGRVSVAEILRTDCEYCEEEEGGGGGGEEHHVVEVEECCVERGGCSKFVSIEKVNDECGHRRKGVLHCVVSPVAMKRSVSSGRFFLRRNTVINPL